MPRPDTAPACPRPPSRGPATAYRRPRLLDYGTVSRRTLGGSGPMPENIMIGMLTIMINTPTRYP